MTKKKESSDPKRTFSTERVIITIDLTGTNEVPKHKTSVAVGLFDGLHCGHRAVIKQAVDIAGRYNCVEPAVFTFETDTVTSKGSGGIDCILSKELKHEFMERLGIRYIYSPDFMNFKNLTAEEFVTLVLCDKLSAEYVISGEDFRFGAGASSGVSELIRLCKKRGIEVIIVPPVMQDGLKISSTIIREHIRSGEIKAANRLLGYQFQFKLPVTYGNRIGRTINFPTINQYLPKRQLVPKYGVYASRVKYNGRFYSAITNIGIKPTVGSNNMPLAETHIMNFNDNLYGETVTILLIDFIRPERKFGSIEELSEQIKLDIQAANKILRKE